MNAAPTFSTTVAAGVHPDFPHVGLSAICTAVQVLRFPPDRLPDDRTVPGRSGLLEKFPEIPVAVLISLSFYMKVIVAKLMLDDADELIHPVLPVSFRIDFNVVIVKPVPAARCPQSRIEVYPVAERTAERIPRNRFGQMLELPFIHDGFRSSRFLRGRSSSA